MKQFLFIYFLSITLFTFSKSKLESRDYILDSKVFNEKRTISVFLPNVYNSDNSTKEFPVAYLFDGQFQPYFSMVTSIMSYYEQTQQGIPMIIVSVHSKSRWGEFVPICDGQVLDSVEGADKLTLFLTNEVIPFIESKYRTNHFKIGIGHSLGGTFVINEALKENSLFNAVIAISPNLTICNEQIINRAQELIKNEPNNRKFIYTTAGNIGDMENDFRKSLIRIDSIFSTNDSIKYMYWYYNLLDKHNHMTTFVPSFDAAYLLLSSKLTLMDDDLLAMASDSSSSIVVQINHFYDELSSFSKQKQTLYIDQVMKFTATLAQYGKFKACIELCQYSTEMLKEADISTNKKKEIAEMISNRQIRAEFNALAQEANILAKSGDYVNASNLYKKAFDMNLIQATHMVRINAVPVFAQAGKIEEAFVQLDLLANKFKLGSNAQFINDLKCEPLHHDKRWNEVMEKLAKNGKLYR